MDVIDGRTGTNRNGRKPIQTPVAKNDPDYHDIVAGCDTVSGGEGDDIMVGDNSGVFVPYLDGSTRSLRTVDPVSKSMKSRLVVEDRNYNKELSAHLLKDHDPYNRKRNHQNVRLYYFDQFLGNDTLSGNGGEDFMVGDYGWIAMPVLKATADRTQLKNLDRELSSLNTSILHIETEIAQRNAARRLANRISVGNDTLVGGDGDDMLLGDYARIIRPTVVGNTAVRYDITYNSNGHHLFVSNRGVTLDFANDTLIGGSGWDLIDGQRGKKNTVIDNERAPKAADYLARIRVRFAPPLNLWLTRLQTDVTDSGSDLSLEGLFFLGIAG
jgi:Ca2+-binding RTX toxin-like protein